jgi:2-dehydro-3-deoxyphosphogluconate aldolase/(4S)-4-hydroxy-2-oxoglutarate aldolase
MSVVEEIEAGRLVPVIVVEDEASAAPLADALIAGGLRCAEVTFRTSAAQAALRVMAADGRLLVGAGTVVTPDQVDAAVESGAAFIVSPGFNAAVVSRCLELGVPTFPGVATASDVMAAIAAELDVVKFFPAEPLGGVKMISALAAPFPSMRFIPTGGITAELLPRYLAHPAVAAVGGSWMVAPKLIAGGEWDEITRLTAEAVATAARTGE